MMDPTIGCFTEIKTSTFHIPGFSHAEIPQMWPSGKYDRSIVLLDLDSLVNFHSRHKQLG